MIPEQSILRRLPKTLSREQLILLDGLVFFMDALEISYGRMRTTAEQYHPSEGIKFPQTMRTSLFSDAGVMVSSGHLIIQLLCRAKDWLDTPEIRSFCQEHGEVTLLRNKLNHIHNQIGNFSRNRTRMPPLQGIISYAFFNVKTDQEQRLARLSEDFFIVNMNIGAEAYPFESG